MISFRLSDREYDTIKSLCQSQGVRSISDFARLAIDNLIATDGLDGEAAIRSRLDALSSRLQVLDLAVGRLSTLVETASRESS